ncbi:imidazolonepropionase-like amidohydrolase [Amycolatopsis bartoniae]|uniref:Peptidase M38 n=1 Tax=Amycolatopsis bartoniae TaxID=941986 RepID=A0A8H9IS62_9PSEU|nr:amidohydrolase family protein [Amycolatopsis bartoniae]MBB2937046.1 imidazolonepropionase-like amidohydrolase [Amycolatopsis bartoniae]TVT01049.1 amidohydrolase family protein [Amycolatopsis bartoniae]GHF52052.1 peptidase M38 [Amycolatopsis bartoniae]
MRLSIVNGAVFDGESAELLDGPVHVEDGEIVQLGGEFEADRTLDARGGTVVPGLIDAHFHAYGISLDLVEIGSKTPSYVAYSGADRLRKALHRGFTTVRDVAGGDPGISRALEEGLITGPRYLYTGPALSQTGGHGDPRGVDTDFCGCHEFMNEVVDGVDALRAAVRDRFRRGAHAIKIMASGGVVSLTDPIRVPQYSPEEVRVVTEEAARRGSYVAAHAYSPEAIRHAVENGVRSIEHGNLLDEETAALMASSGAFLVPTLATYDAMNRRGAELGMPGVTQAKNREVLDSGRHALELARAAGVPIGFGTDLMGVLEDEQLNGLRLQTEVEGPLQALRSATSVNAALLRRPDLGRIAVGCAADLLVLDGDPFADPSVLWKGPRQVVRSGQVV